MNKLSSQSLHVLIFRNRSPGGPAEAISAAIERPDRSKRLFLPRSQIRNLKIQTFQIDSPIVKRSRKDLAWNAVCSLKLIHNTTLGRWRAVCKNLNRLGMQPSRVYELDELGDHVVGKVAGQALKQRKRDPNAP
jgi:hypothetical protein